MSPGSAHGREQQADDLASCGGCGWRMPELCTLKARSAYLPSPVAQGPLGQRSTVAWTPPDPSPHPFAPPADSVALNAQGAGQAGLSSLT